MDDVTEAAGSSRSLGPYRLDRVLGRGGFGVVYLARHRESGLPWALKIPTTDGMHPEEWQRNIHREVARTQNLRHPHVVPVLEVAANHQPPYFVMPFCEHGNLAEARARGEFLPAAEQMGRIIAVLRQVADALDYVHSKGNPEGLSADNLEKAQTSLTRITTPAASSGSTSTVK